MNDQPEKRPPRFSPGTWAAVISALLLLFLTFVFCRVFLGRSPEQEPDVVARSLEGMPESPAPRAENESPADALDEGTAETAEPSQNTPIPGMTAVPAENFSRFTLAAGGTVNVSRPVREFTREGNRYDFSTVFLGLGSRITGADLTLCTLETMTDDRLPYDQFNAPSSLLDSLSDAGVDFVSLGTEHMLDKGYDSLDVTLSELNIRSMIALGVREDAGSLPGTVLRIGGIRTAVLAYTFGIDEAGNSATKNDRRGAAALLSDEKRVAQDIAAVRAGGAEAVILLVHWGVRNRTDVPESVRTLAERLAAAGADLILGTHPSVVQNVEKITVRRADGLMYDTVVAYSLGSLLTDARTAESAAGLVLLCTFEKDPLTGRVGISSLSAVPTYVARQEEEGTVSWRVVEADSEASLSVLEPDERAAALNAAAIVNGAMSGVRQEPQTSAP